MLVSLIGMILLQLAFFIAAATTFGKNKVAIPYFPRRVKITGVLFSVLIAVILLTCFSWLGEWFYLFLETIGYKTTSLEFNGAVEITLAAFVTVILAPVMEETVFRSALLGGLATRYKKWTCVVLSGLCFSLMHMSAEQTVYQFFLGCACALVTIESGNYLYAIIIHAFNNLAAILLSLLGPESVVNALVFPGNPLISVPVTLGLAALGGIAIVLICKKMRVAIESRGEEGQPSGIIASLPYKLTFIVAVVISAVMWISNFIGSMIL